MEREAVTECLAHNVNADRREVVKEVGMNREGGWRNVTRNRFDSRFLKIV